MTRALLVAPGYPYPIDGGNKVSLHGYIVAMRAAGIDSIDFVGFKGSGLDQGELSSVTLVDKPSRLTVRAVSKHVAGRSIVMERYFSQAFLDQLWIRASESRYDVVLFQHAYMAQYLARMSDCFKGSLRLASSEVLESRAYRKKAVLATDPFRKLLFGREARLLDRQETDAFSDFHKVVFYSDEDREHYRRCDGLTQSEVVSLGLDMSRYLQLEPTRADGLIVGFFGSFGWFANLDALNFLLNEIWPVVRSRFPDARLRIAGRDIPEWAGNFSREGVEILGRVDSIRDFLSDVHAVVCPVRIGGGIRLKILETLAWGRPVVSTLAGVEGLEQDLRRFVRVANSGDEFSQALGLLISDEGALEGSESACIAVRRQYDATALSRLFRM